VYIVPAFYYIDNNMTKRNRKCIMTWPRQSSCTCSKAMFNIC